MDMDKREYGRNDDEAFGEMLVAAAERGSEAAMACVLASPWARAAAPEAFGPAIEICASMGNAEVLAAILNSRSDWPAGELADEAIMNAAYRENFDCIKLLVGHGWSLDGNAEESALSEMIRAGSVESISELLALGANVEARGKIEPLAMAAGYGRLDAVRILLAAGADPNGMGQGGWGPAIVSAAREGAADGAEIVGLLAKAGADIEARDGDGSTALHLACRGDSSDMARALLALGADPMTKNDKGQTPLDIALDAGAQEAALVMLEHGPELDGDGLASAWARASGSASSKVKEVLRAMGESFALDKSMGRPSGAGGKHGRPRM